MKTLRFTILIWIVLNSPILAAHVMSVASHSQSGNDFAMYCGVFLLALTYDLYNYWLTWKKYHKSNLEEISDILVLVYSAAVFSGILSLEYVEFGIIVFTGLLAKSIIQRWF
jgi:hypothetical protein